MKTLNKDFISPSVDLVQAAESFRVLFNNMDTAYLVVDRYFNILFFNDVAQRWSALFGIEALEQNTNFLERLAPERQVRISAGLKKALSGESVTYEFTRTNTVEPHWFLARIFPLKVSQNNVEGVCIYIADINERKQIETELKRSNDRYDIVSKITSDAIWDWNLIDNSLYFNDTYKNLFGIQETDYANNIFSWENRIHPEDRARVIFKLNKVLEEGQQNYWEDEYRYQKQDNSYAYVHDRGNIVFNDEKKAVRMVGAMQDITSRKLYEIEREKITADLIQRNQDLEQFAFIVSHNLRSHIANILGLSDLINMGLLAQEEKDSIFQTLNVSAKKLDSVIKDLSLILQIKRDVSEKKQKVQFAELIHDVQVSLFNNIQKEEAQIITNFRNADNIYSVKSYLYSILHNLISNSLKYRKGNVAPVIKIYSELTENNIILHYKDNGLGIDMKANGHNVFGLYKRFHSNIEGKGMGLFMVKTQVESLGGKIDLRSSPNEGVEFTIVFNRNE